MPLPMRHPLHSLLFCASALAAIVPCAAQAATDDMRFSYQREDYRKYGLGLYQVIHGTGTITDGTTDRLKMFVQENHVEPGGELYLDSTGGNRLEGMRLGRLIRTLGLITHIGNTNPAQGGTCQSACAFAFLGGTYRFMPASATYGVHRFYRSQGADQEFTLQESQAVAQQMTDYMREMGANPALFKYMANNTGSDIVLLDQHTLIELGVVNNGTAQSGWRLLDDHGVPYISADVTGYKGTSSLRITCDRQRAAAKAAVSIAVEDADALRRVSSRQGLVLGESQLPLDATPETTSASTLSFSFSIPRELALRMIAAPKLGAYVQPATIPYGARFELQQDMESQDTMKTFFRNCYGKELVIKDDGIRY